MTINELKRAVEMSSSNGIVKNYALKILDEMNKDELSAKPKDCSACDRNFTLHRKVEKRSLQHYENEWIDVYAKALYQAAVLIENIARSEITQVKVINEPEWIEPFAVYIKKPGTKCWELIGRRYAYRKAAANFAMRYVLDHENMEFIPYEAIA